MSGVTSPGAGTYSVRSGLVAKGQIRVPPSKSLTQRWLNLALLAGRPLELEDPLVAADVEQFLRGLGHVGFDSEMKQGALTLSPSTAPPGAHIDCGQNGTMLRFLVAALATKPGTWRLDGSDRLRQRPIGPLVEALRSLGAQIAFAGNAGYVPVEIEGGTLEGGLAQLDCGISSQFGSALLMAACRSRREVQLHLTSLVSAPYLDLTIECIRTLGGNCERLGESDFRVAPSDLNGGRYRVEGDYSAAAYPAAAALLTSGRVELLGLPEVSAQADREFIDVLQAIGAEIEWGREQLTIVGRGELSGIDIDMSRMPDQVPTLAALAPFARGSTRIRNVPHLRVKESDRLSAMTSELEHLGAEVREYPDGLEIQGVWADRQPPGHEVTVESHDDHRVAMSLALCGLRRPGLSVANGAVVSKSYPSFWHDLDALLAG